MALTLETANIFWMLLSAALVMLMQGGFCFLESGLARAKNSINVAMKNLADFCVAGILFWVCGFAIMFGIDWNGFAGTSFFALNETEDSWLLAFFLFQLVFCGTATTIVSGAVAERMRFSGYLIVSGIVSAVIYPVFGHWAWGGVVAGTGSGWLSEMGFIDFAGSTVVHSVGGWVALSTVILVGPRLGRFNQENKPMHGHNYPMAALGTILLWFGWFGFNGGSTLAMDGSVPLVLVNTNLAAAAGGVAALIVSWINNGRANVGDIMNGVIAGLVGITASCHIMTPIASIIIGAIAAALCLGGMRLLEQYKVDDVISAVPAHAFAGAWGTLAVALLADPAKFGTGLSTWQQLNVQAIGVTTCFLWAGGVSLVLVAGLKMIMPLRVSEEAERQGLNISEHDASTELIDLLTDMRQQSEVGEFHQQVQIEPHTEVGQIATEYNKVLNRVVEEIEAREVLVDQLKQAEEKFRSIFENATEGIFRSTTNGKLLEANPSFVKLLDRESADELCHSVENIGDELFQSPEDWVHLVRELKSKGIVTEFATQLIRRDDSSLQVSINASLVKRDPSGEEYVDARVVDITEKLRADQLYKEKKAAEAANKAKSAFLATMSHEIRTPLNGVIGMLDLLVESELHGKQKRYATIAQSSAESLLSLINDILDFSKIEAGKLELDCREFNLPTLIEDVTDMFGQKADQKGLELNCHVLPEVASRVIGDGERLRQVIVNLVSNAIKFTDSGEVSITGSVIKADLDTQTIRFEVRDTGIGIPLEIQKKLFQAFEQADASTTRKFGGTGLGLAICRQLVELMDGRIGVESTPGEGTSFYCEMSFPVVKRVSKFTSPDQRFANLRILAVDDNSTNRTILQSQLETWGASVDTAADAAEALKMAKDSVNERLPYDLIITDYNMPQTDGIGFATQVQEDGVIRGIPIVMLTSSDGLPPIEELRDVGVKACSLKPIRASRLFDEVISVIYEDDSEDFDEQSTNQEPKLKDVSADFTGKRILIADDNEINQIVTQEIVEQAGFQCRVVSNGKEVIEALRRRKYDLILMDCQMPVMDGFTATTEIRSTQNGFDASLQRIPVIALTANAVKGDREKCLAAGMNDYVTKPIDPQLLISTIHNHLSADVSESIEIEDVLETIPREPKIDWHSCIDRCGGSEDIAKLIVKKFASRLTDDVESISTAFSDGDVEECGRQAHKLKGAAASVSAVDVASLAGRIESAASNQRIEEIPDLLKELEVQAIECLDFLKDCEEHVISI